MRRGSFPLGYELFGQIFVCGTHKKIQITITGSYVHVSGVQNEGDHPANCGEIVHIYRQFHQTQRVTGKCTTKKKIHIRLRDIFCGFLLDIIRFFKKKKKLA